MQEILDFLKKIGTSDKETKVYLACLELGESSIVPIREKCALPRTTVFHILEKLRDKNLIEIIETGKRRLYVPHPPRKILTLLKEKQENIQETVETLETILPQLNRMYSFSPFQPRIRFFKGDEIRNIYEEILDSPIEEFLYVGQTNKLTEILSHDFFNNWVKRKVEKGIWTRSLRVKTTEDPFFDPKKDLRKARFLPDDFKCSVHFYIYGDNVAVLTSLEENFGIVTTSREYAIAMKSWFNELWKISNKE